MNFFSKRRRDVFHFPSLNWDEFCSLRFKQDRFHLIQRIISYVFVCRKLLAAAVAVVVVMAAVAAAAAAGDVI